MDQLIFASLSYTHYWYEVGMLKVPAVCMVITYSRVWINRVRLPILQVAKNKYSPDPVRSREFGLARRVQPSRPAFSRPVPRQPAHLQSTQAESGAYLRDSSRFPRRRPFIYLNRHTPSGQFRVYRVRQLRTDGVHCRESAGIGPIVLEVNPVTGTAIL